MILGADGSLYGTTTWGGNTNDAWPNGMGAVFKVTTNGILTSLTSFNGTNGVNPGGSLAIGPDGNYYGTTYSGGIDGGNYGTVFAVTTNGSLTSLASFSGSNGANPNGGLLLATDGNFYGTTQNGGAAGYGTVFRLAFSPTITLQPQSQTNPAGSTAVFLVNAVEPSPTAYQWRKNGLNLSNGGNISGANTNALTITSISDSDAGSYSVLVSNRYGSVSSSNAVLMVDDSLVIASQPISQTVGLGSNVTFDVIVYGASPFVFRWYFNGSPVGPPTAGTNHSSYTLTNVGTNQAGNYSVLVVNPYGSLMSSNALLTVQVFPPLIEMQPTGQSVLVGGSARFTVSVVGSPPFTYQWRLNGADIPSATTSTYVIRTVAASDTGNYSVVIANSAGTVASSNAFLTVIIPPTVVLQFWAGYPLLELYGMLNSNFVVQYRTNLAGANWMNLISLTNLQTSPYLFLDPGGVAQRARYYRAYME